MYAADLSWLRKGLGGSFYKIFVWVLLSLNTRCGRGRACFVVVGKIGAFISDRFQWILSDISSLPRRNATGVVCIFLIWGIDDVYIVLFSVKPLTVTCAGLSLSLVLIVVFLVVRDRSKRKVPRFLEPRSRHRRSPMTGIDTTAPDTGVRQRVVVRTPPHRPSTSMQFGVISQ